MSLYENKTNTAISTLAYSEDRPMVAQYGVKFGRGENPCPIAYECYLFISWTIFHFILSSADFFSKLNRFQEYHFGCQNTLDSGWDQRFVGSDFRGPNLQRLHPVQQNTKVAPINEKSYIQNVHLIHTNGLSLEVFIFDSIYYVIYFFFFLSFVNIKISDKQSLSLISIKYHSQAF